MTRAERQAALVAAHRAGDRAALPELAADVAGLARWVAGRYSRPGVDREDLVGEAWVGFMDAVNSYDAARGPFASHCATWMRARVSRAVTVGLGSRGSRRAFWRGSAAVAEIEAEGGEATQAAVAERLGVTEGDVARARARDVALGEHEPAPATDIDGMLDDARAMRQLRSAISTLPPRLRYVVEAGLEGRDVAMEMGVSKQRVQQLKAKAIDKLREEMRR